MSKPATERYTVACDFDGVLHSYVTPWIDARTIPDPPVPGAIEWLREISKDFNVVILTTRGKDAEGQEAVADYLYEHGWEGAVSVRVTDQKVAALVYVDDRGWRFTGNNFPTKEEIHRARPWNKAVAPVTP